MKSTLPLFTQPLCYFILLMLLLFGSCQRDQQAITITLDKVIYNSYHQNFRGRNTIELRENETVLYDEGRQKVSTRSADVLHAGGRFRLSLVDANQNGDFSEVGIDLVALSVYGQDTVALDLKADNFSALRARTFVQINREFFLLELTANGKTVTLLPWDRPPTEALTARTKTHLAKLTVKDKQGEEQLLHLTGAKQRLLVFWSYNEADIKLLRDLNEQRQRWRKKVDLISFNMRDQLRPLHEFQTTHAIDFPLYIVTSKTCQSINCHTHTPHAMLLDEKGEILRTDMKEMEIREFLGLGE